MNKKSSCLQLKHQRLCCKATYETSYNSQLYYRPLDVDAAFYETGAETRGKTATNQKANYKMWAW